MNPNQKESVPVSENPESNNDLIKELQSVQDTTSFEKSRQVPKIPSTIISDDDTQITDKKDAQIIENPPVNKSENSAPSNLIAEDVDVIEKEWVDRAKKVIDDNKENPRQQGHEMNFVKKDYLKKRYDKELKVESDD